MDQTFPTIADFFASMPGGDETHTGNGRANRLIGGDTDDMILGRGGNDRLVGRDGNDHIKGGPGADRLIGGTGADLLEGQSGNDRSVGGDGGDYILDMRGHNRVNAGDGDDVVRTGNGRDRISAGDGDDMVMAGGGHDRVNGGDGDDVIWGQGGEDRLRGGDGDDALYGGTGRDNLNGGRGNDLMDGGRGNDRIISHLGSDTIDGGQGNDWILSRSDSGEPVIAQNPALDRYYPDNPIEASDDVITGGKGADTFRFRLDIDATLEIAQKHADENGVINWRDVAGENDNPHDHWVNGIGDDLITDFSKAEGDKIVIRGHTVNAAIEQIDLNDDGTLESSRITLYSDQGAGGGAHNQDKLGTITVQDALLADGDISVAANVFYGAYVTVDDLIMG